MKKELDEVKEIKPCPFCGGEAVCFYGGETRCVGCRVCGSKGALYSIFTYHPSTALQKAIKAWNKRK